MSIAYSEVLKIIQIFITLPNTTTGNGRFFFTLSLIKTYLRSTMGDETLSDLMLMFSEKKNCLKSLDFEAMVGIFGKMRPCPFPVLQQNCKLLYKTVTI